MYCIELFCFYYLIRDYYMALINLGALVNQKLVQVNIYNL